MKKVNGFSMSVKIILLEKSKWLLNVRENNSSGLAVIGIFQKNQLKNKYVEIKMENV